MVEEFPSPEALQQARYRGWLSAQSVLLTGKAVPNPYEHGSYEYLEYLREFKSVVEDGEHDNRQTVWASHKPNRAA